MMLGLVNFFSSGLGKIVGVLTVVATILTATGALYALYDSRQKDHEAKLVELGRTQLILEQTQQGIEQKNKEIQELNDRLALQEKVIAELQQKNRRAKIENDTLKKKIVESKSAEDLTTTTKDLMRCFKDC